MNILAGLSVAAVLVLLATPARGQEMQPGMYATTTVMDGAVDARAVQDKDCITAKDIVEGLTKLGIESDSQCKAANFTKGNGKVRYQLVCEEDGRKQIADVAGNYTATSFEFVVKPQGKDSLFRNITIKGKRIGSCK